MKELLMEFLNAKNYLALKDALKDVNPADIPTLFDELGEKDLIILFRLLPKDSAAEAFAYMDRDIQEKLINLFSDKELGEVLDGLFMDDTVDIIEEMPASVVKRILKASNPDSRKIINEILKYPKDSAGSIMTTELIDLREQMTVSEAFERIRRTGITRETIYTCYVTENRKLLGIVTVKDMLVSNNTSKISDIMETNIISVNTHEDRELAAGLFRKYDFLALPVVDTENRLVGIITIDDVLDVLDDEVSEDIAKMAAITPSNKPYLKTGVLDTWKSRMPWLMFLMISATFTGKIIFSFENALSSYVVLAGFIPMIMDTGGNAGSQASVTIIRSLSLNEVHFKDIWKIILKELRVSFLCGITLAAAGFIKFITLDKMSLPVSFVVCLTLLFTVVAAKLMGCCLPMLAKKIGFDPAVMASPFITTIVDAMSLMVYFNLATVLLHL